MLKEIEKDAINIGKLFIFMFIILKIIYLKEDFLIVLRLLLSIFLIYLIPTYLFFLNYKIEFVFKVIYAFGLGIALVNILMYFASKFFNLTVYQTIIFIPVLIFLCSFYYDYWNNYRKK